MVPPWYPLSGDDQRLLRRDCMIRNRGGLKQATFRCFTADTARKRTRGAILFSCAAFVLVAWAAQTAPTPKPASILSYIQRTWVILTRSNRGLAVAAPDPKFPSVHEPWPVYLSRSEDLQRVKKQLSEEMKPEDFRKLRISALPEDLTELTEQGLLYLPRPYVVPGGRFNEMYGWDSYFVHVGLLRDGEIALAKDMADDLLYEIRQYGKILNANRTYYLKPLATAVPHRGIARRLRADSRSRMAGRCLAGHRQVLPLLDERAACDGRNPALALLGLG